MRLFLLALVFLFSFSASRDLQADTELKNPYVNDYPFKSVIIQFKTEFKVGYGDNDDYKSYVGTEELYIKGNKTLRTTTKEIPDEDSKKQTVKGMKLVTPEKEYVISLDEKEAVEIDNPRKHGKAKYEELTEEEKMEFHERMEKRKVVSMDLLGIGHKVGTDTILGKECDVYESGRVPNEKDYMESFLQGSAPIGYAKVWVWREAGIPLKVIKTDMGSSSETVATKIEENVDIPDSKLTVPEGIDVFFDERASESAMNEALSRFELYKYGVRQNLRFKASGEVLTPEGEWVPADSPEGKKLREEAEAKRKAKIGATPAPETKN